MTRIFKPTYVVESLGEMGRLPDGGIINAGGVSGSTFTVGGRPLMFADGGSTGGGSGNAPFSLQGSYNASAVPAQIDLAASKNFVLNALNDNKFIFDASTGAVTIQGNLTVLGATTVIDSEIQNVDQINIGPPTGSTVGLNIEPTIGVAMTGNLVQIKSIFGGPNVFTVGPTGDVSITNLTVGLINGINLTSLAATVANHVDAATVPAKHTAAQISANTTGLTNVTGDDVQEVIESIDLALSTIVGGPVANVQGYEHVQTVPATVWIIPHGKNSRRIQITVWDETEQAILSDSISIFDMNTVYVAFSTPATGRAILMIF